MTAMFIPSSAEVTNVMAIVAVRLVVATFKITGHHRQFDSFIKGCGGREVHYSGAYSREGTDEQLQRVACQPGRGKDVM
mgnify:CR=1 FL=1